MHQEHIEFLSRRMREAIAAEDLNEAIDFSLTLTVSGVKPEGVNLDDLIASNLLRALDGADTVVDAVECVADAVASDVSEAFWLGVLKELAAGALKSLTSTARIVPPVMRTAAREALERHNKMILEILV